MAGVLVQLVRSLWCKHQGLRPDPQTAHNQATLGGRGRCLASLPEAANSRFSERPSISNTSGDRRGLHTWQMHMCKHSHGYMYTSTGMCICRSAVLGYFIGSLYVSLSSHPYSALIPCHFLLLGVVSSLGARTIFCSQDISNFFAYDHLTRLQ